MVASHFGRLEAQRGLSAKWSLCVVGFLAAGWLASERSIPRKNIPRGRNGKLPAQFRALPGDGSVFSTTFYGRTHNRLVQIEGVEKRTPPLDGSGGRVHTAEEHWEGRDFCGHLWNVGHSDGSNPDRPNRDCDLNL